VVSIVMINQRVGQLAQLHASSDAAVGGRQRALKLLLRSGWS
jgi:hypothetical protein